MVHMPCATVWVYVYVFERVYTHTKLDCPRTRSAALEDRMANMESLAAEMHGTNFTA